MCPSCPLAAACAAAETIIEKYPHTDRTQAIGGVALTREALSQVVQQIGCSGPAANMNSQVVCPNEAAAFLARGMGAAPWPKGNYAIPLDQITETAIEPPTVPGQYL